MKFRCQRRCAALFRGSQTLHQRAIAEQVTSSTAWREDRRVDPVAVTLQREQALSRGSRPHLRSAVAGGSQHLLVVGREDCRVDRCDRSLGDSIRCRSMWPQELNSGAHEPQPACPTGVLVCRAIGGVDGAGSEAPAIHRQETTAPR